MAAVHGRVRQGVDENILHDPCEDSTPGRGGLVHLSGSLDVRLRVFLLQATVQLCYLRSRERDWRRGVGGVTEVDIT